MRSKNQIRPHPHFTLTGCKEMLVLWAHAHPYDLQLLQAQMPCVPLLGLGHIKKNTASHPLGPYTSGLLSIPGHALLALTGNLEGPFMFRPWEGRALHRSPWLTWDGSGSGGDFPGRNNLWNPPLLLHHYVLFKQHQLWKKDQGWDDVCGGGDLYLSPCLASVEGPL